MVAGGGYDFGTVRVAASAGSTNPEGPNNKVSYAHVGGVLRFGGGHQVLAQAIRLKTEVAGGRGTTLGLSSAYDLSKRTNL